MKKIIQFIKESYAELKKVNWPTKDDVVAQTTIVVISLIVISIILTLIDFVSLEIIANIISIGM